jgi:3-hydroxyisobutyrate dehydrogenase-like beta-hydroxyacid dehydrogenase
VAVLGFGEAGAAIAADLVKAGAQVRGYDPVAPAPAGVKAAASDADACRGADLVLSLTTAAQAESALRQSLADGGLAGPSGRPASGPSGRQASGPSGRQASGSVVYADANTAAAGLKQRLAATAADAGISFADIAIMAPIPGRGLSVPLLGSGPGAELASLILSECGASIEVLDGPAGAAATRKLLRSVFYKGMSAAIIEALLAARAAGCEDWLREHIAAELEAADASTLDRMERGSYQHALRRSHEMAAAAELLDELSVPARIAKASQLWLEDLAGSL